MSKYKLTFWQRLELIPVRVLWLLADPEKRKSWHLVKKGFEKHEHRFTILRFQGGEPYYQCEHEGCDMCDVPDITWIQ